MNSTEYNQLFEQILSATEQVAPYDDPAFLEYAKLNASRFKRWQKTMPKNEQFEELLKATTTKQHWIIISEPWCGDAAHIVPFLIYFAELSPNITYDIQLRDAAPFLIDSYLTNGGKAIPKLISRGEDGNDLFVWGPRPVKIQDNVNKLKQEGFDMDHIKVELQNWYNADKGQALMQELTTLIQDL